MVTPRKAAGSADAYEQIDRLTRTGVSVLGNPTSPTAAIASAGGSYKQANRLVTGLTAPGKGTPEHDRYMLAKDQVSGLKDAIAGYARTAMRQRVNDVYSRIRGADYSMQRRESGIISLRPSANPFKAIRIGSGSESSAAEQYTRESKDYIRDVFDAFKGTGLSQAGDSEFKEDLNLRLKKAEETLGRKAAEHSGAERARDIRRRSRLP